MSPSLRPDHNEQIEASTSSPRRVGQRCWQLALVVTLLGIPGGPAWSQRSRLGFDEARRQMVEKEIIGAGVTTPRIIEAMLATPRHEFVASRYRKFAYFDMSLPIGGEQTISSPFIVAFMTETIDPQPTDRVLEIGTGSGFQAAVLSPLVDKVYTIEIVPSLGKRAAKVLRRLNYDNVHVKVGDGFQGWPEHAPFDKILVTCSPEDVPQPLVDQLRDGGRMVIPVGERYQQTLYLFKKENGKLEKESLRPTLFVPMTGTAEANRDVKPDPARPKVVNGGFEETPDPPGTTPGWYYGRQFEISSDGTSPEGQSHVEFRNGDDGRGSRLLQGFAVDGRFVTRVRLSTWFRCENVRRSNLDALPLLAISFYDKDRREIGQNFLGPWRGTQPWKDYESVIRVPKSAREAIVRIGLFGATGTAAFDDVRIDRL